MWDDDHLFFADICSPQTIANIRAGSLVEVNVVDPFVRKGYRFKGPAVIHEPGSAVFAEGIERMRADGSKLTGRVEAIVVIEVRHAAPLVSPAYDDGPTRSGDARDPARAVRATARTSRPQVARMELLRTPRLPLRHWEESDLPARS